MKKLSYTPQKRFGIVLLFVFIATVSTSYVAKENIYWGEVFQKNDQIKNSIAELEIAAIDLTSEPGEFSSNLDLEHFYSRQEIINQIFQENQILLTSQGKTVALQKNQYSFFDLPFMFWIQIIVGLGAAIISGWVWSLRPRILSAIFFFTSGLSTLIFTFAAAVYTTRELALPVSLFKCLTKLNTIGASLFGISIIALFLIYPLRFRLSKPILLTQAFFFGFWTILSVLGVLPAWMGVNLITLVEMLAIVLIMITQVILTKGKPKERASLTWIGLSVFVGAGGFIALNAIPLVFEIEIPMAQGYAFLLFLAFYLGLAAGIGRYRLFDVGSWAFSFLFYSMGAALVIILDVLFMSLMSLNKSQALGVSLLMIGLLYLPFREGIRIFFKREKKLRPQELIKEALFVTLSPNAQEKKHRWESLLQKTLNPLELNLSSMNYKEAKIIDDGVVLGVPSLGTLPPYHLIYANGGKSLFNSEAKSIVNELIKLIQQADTSRETYDRGVQEERERIAQDLHDDVVARLLTGLHAPVGSDLRSIIQGAIKDVRTIIKGITSEELSFQDLISELRVESIDRLGALDIELEWPLVKDQRDFPINYHTYKAIASTVREAISNTIKHSGATVLNVHYVYGENELEFYLKDNGVNNFNNRDGKGFGLNNMKKRITDIHGEIQITSLDPGLQIYFKVPL
ncbi:MAG: hypothetical protein H6620_07200 [Halobacteriovoraceae bacterium]|nr:hypothetical protein [Halobacteriovoraceae bacterium]